MAEVIIALPVIVIISAAAVVLISAQIRTETRAARTVTATNMAENAIECFRYACDTETTFEVAFEKCGYEVTPGENGIYTTEYNGVFGTVEIVDKQISVTVKNASGETIVSVENYLVARP